jgi:hypothetical protein
MCFGNKVTDTKATAVPQQLTDAASSNTAALAKLRDAGYQAYQGQRVADQTPDTETGAGMIRSLAGTTNPYTSTIAGAATNAATAGPQRVSAGRTIDNVPGANGGPAGTTQDYMDPYLSSVLAPQLRDIDLQTIKNQQGLDAQATMGGAFGDARTGIQAAENTRLGNQARTDTIGRGYSGAFNNAMGLKTADINRNLDVGKTNAALGEQGFARALAGGQALQGLDSHNTGRQADLAGLLGKVGEARRTNNQAKLDAAYQEFSKATGYPIEVAKAITASLNPHAYGHTETQSKPDNSGYGMVGTLAGTALGAALGGPVGASIGGSLGGSLSSGLSGTGWGSPYGGSPETNANLNPGTYGNVGSYAPSPGFADGGDPPVGQPSLVGERGPELFVPKEAGTVIPSETIMPPLMAALAGRGVPPDLPRPQGPLNPKHEQNRLEGQRAKSATQDTFGINDLRRLLGMDLPTPNRIDEPFRQMKGYP